ncbi:hypothetical protein RF185_23070, partial [Escherichia coli]|nr:hypothetical protein [Escherichia coli]
MHQNSVTLDSAGAITRYFAKANLGDAANL